MLKDPNSGLYANLILLWISEAENQIARHLTVEGLSHKIQKKFKQFR